VNGGVQYFSNFLNWMQNASVVMRFGGLRSPGLVTRLTLWLALLGASMATAKRKHINVDVVMRFLSPKLRVPAALVGWLAAAVMCLAAVWGFTDHIAIEDFKVQRYPPSCRLSARDDSQIRDRIGGIFAWPSHRSRAFAYRCPVP
jgi:hypothetical protein